MSGAQTSTFGGYLYSGFMIATGLVNVFLPVGSRTWNDNLWGQRLAGALTMLVGLLYLIHPLGFMHEPGFLFAMGGFALLVALFVMVIEPRLQARALRRYEAELSRVALAANDRAESLRAFHANSPYFQHPLRRWLGGGILVIFGICSLTLGLTAGSR